MSIAHFGATNVGTPLQLFGSNRMTASGGTPPTGYDRGNFGIMTPDTVEGFDWELMQTPVTPGFVTVQIRTVTDLGQDYFTQIEFRDTGNDPVWFDTVLEASLATYFFIGGVGQWSYTSGAPGFFIQGSPYDIELFRK